MRSIERKHDGRRILLPVAVLPSRNPTDLTHEMYIGLLDTGATASWVSSRVVSRFDLKPSGKRPVIVATEPRLRDSYVFRLGLLGDGLPEHALPIVFAETIGFKIDQADGFDVLLGMDILRDTDFSMSRDGRWHLRFG